MEMQELYNAIATLGYPIVVSGVLAYIIKTTNEKHDKTITDINNKNNETIQKLSKVVDKNTESINQLITLIKEKM